MNSSVLASVTLSASSAAFGGPRFDEAAPLELWGGVECTFNRVEDRFFDQLEWSGHQNRVADLELFANLGMSAVRYPVIWEKLAPHCPTDINWSWPDERLSRLRELGIAPIADLVHHGSGPRYAEIQSPAFAPGLAAFAGQIARRYPWIEAYTPVNEPLTTARFCGLYGHWFPHGRGNDGFVRILLNECRAIALAMQAVREVNSDAKLVQTDDLGRIFSTPHLSYQADFENSRRWLSFDLLCGRVDPGHEMWGYLVESGATLRELDWFCSHPCPPDIIGINHYPTSDRYLDENLARYPATSYGENGRDRYADVEAVRVMPEPLGGFAARLGEAWQRYKLPLAITEAHLGCTREEQVRWTHQAWQDAKNWRENGVDVRAVTAWSLLGAWNWNSLVTRDAGYYEPGVFDTRSGTARPTAIAHLLRDLGAEGEAEGQGQGAHPVLGQPGWWQRPERIYYPPKTARPKTARREQKSAPKNPAARPILIIGASGTVGHEMALACRGRGLIYEALTRADIDLFDPDAVSNLLRATDAWAVINASGFCRIDAAETDAARYFALHRDAAANLAAACARDGVALVCFSTDLVFDGHAQRPLLEDDAPHPLSAFGRSKAAMEDRVLRLHPGALVVRSGALFGPYDDKNFVTQTLRALARGEVVRAACDAVVSPTYLLDLSQATLDLLVDGAGGLWHLANQGALSWADLAREAAARFGFPTSKIQGATQEELGWLAPRPSFSALGTRNGQILPGLDAALNRFKHDARF